MLNLFSFFFLCMQDLHPCDTAFIIVKIISYFVYQFFFSFYFYIDIHIKEYLIVKI